MFKVKNLLLVLIVSFCCKNLQVNADISATNMSQLTIEEQRLNKAKQMMPDVINRLASNIDQFKTMCLQSITPSDLTKLVQEHAAELWSSARLSYSKSSDFDDRPLYWARLQMTKVLRQASSFKGLSLAQQRRLLWELELLSRGQQDVRFDKNTTFKILVTGFDPFFLDKNLDQSNPSGTAAMALDDLVITSFSGGKNVEIESLIVPVRFEDFDKGMIEELLTPYIQDKSVDMIITISMGRDNFDIERFPGRRRSAKAPDNLNVYTGASAENPLIPLLNKEPLKGAEFVEFSLPVLAMKKASGDFEINDNHKISTTEKSFSPNRLNELSQSIAVSGSGGGYLSNEVSYRSLLLRNQYYPTLPVGHIHTPRFTGFKPEKTEKIIKQIKAMISLAVDEL